MGQLPSSILYHNLKLCAWPYDPFLLKTWLFFCTSKRHIMSDSTANRVMDTLMWEIYGRLFLYNLLCSAALYAYMQVFELYTICSSYWPFIMRLLLTHIDDKSHYGNEKRTFSHCPFNFFFRDVGTLYVIWDQILFNTASCKIILLYAQFIFYMQIIYTKWM